MTFLEQCREKISKAMNAKYIDDPAYCEEFLEFSRTAMPELAKRLENAINCINENAEIIKDSRDKNVTVVWHADAPERLSKFIKELEVPLENAE